MPPTADHGVARLDVLIVVGALLAMPSPSLAQCLGGGGVSAGFRVGETAEVDVVTEKCGDEVFLAALVVWRHTGAHGSLSFGPALEADSIVPWLRGLGSTTGLEGIRVAAGLDFGALLMTGWDYEDRRIAILRSFGPPEFELIGRYDLGTRSDEVVVFLVDEPGDAHEVPTIAIDRFAPSEGPLLWSYSQCADDDLRAMECGALPSARRLFAEWRQVSPVWRDAGR